MLFESWQPNKPLQRGGTHLFDVLKPHMVRDQRENLLHLFIREPEPAANLFAHALPYTYMPVKPDAISGLRHRPERRRLAHIVQEHSPRQCLGCASLQLIKHQQRVSPDISFWMILR